MPNTTLSTPARWALGITGALAALGVLISFILAAVNAYPPEPPIPAHSMGANTDGLAGFLGRIFDTASYFTELSNVVVAVVLLSIVFGGARPTRLWRTLRMDTLVMISVTGLVYALVLGPGAHLRGWEYVSNSLVHYIVPILTVLTFLIWGPRGWFRIGTVFSALIIPIVWLVYTFLRGAVIILGLIFWGLDRLLSRGRRT